MNLKQLSSFLKVVELGSVTRAAGALHTAQSALSRQIQQLEEELGVTLLTRLDRGVKPTDAGLLLQELVTSLLEQTRQLKEAVGARAAEPQGSLSFGFPPSLLDLITLPLLKDYRSRFQKVLLHVTEGISAELLERVQNGRLDAAVVSRSELHDGLECVPLASEPLCLVGPPSASRQLGKRVSLARLSELPLIVTPRPNALRNITDSALNRRKLGAHVAIEANTSRIAIELAVAGLGWAVLPYSAIHLPLLNGTVAAVPITGLRVSWALVYSKARAMSLATQKLRQLLQDQRRLLIEGGHWPGAQLDS